ncbi:hypothetical protein [Celeribacter sp. SCSIO 80788]|jgi:hypothetical protein|uniref:hypothetical protein n=1 Tax=Celeribacter sp. SCSIO 80788 TaxID=3117013 RepID=UPI003DA3280A
MNSELFERRLWIIGQRKELPASDIWSRFLYGSLPDSVLVSLRSESRNIASIKAGKIESILDSETFSSFEVSGTDFCFNYGQNGGQNYDQIVVDSGSKILTPDFADELVSETIASDPCFTQAHLVDRRYEYLQNIYDPLQFKALGLSVAGLPMKSNGLPFPLEQKIVDTSRNPGRFALRQGYIEASAAYMWFGANFWKVTGLSPEAVAAKLPKDVSMRFDVCWKLRASSGVFQSDENRAIQDRIRQAAFG